MSSVERGTAMEIQIDWEMYLAAAKQLPNLRLREGMYLQALKKAEADYGPGSLEVGLVLLDLSDCLEAQGQNDRADECSDRAFSNLRQFVKNQPGLWPRGLTVLVNP